MKKWCPKNEYFFLLLLLLGAAVNPSSGSSTGQFPSFSSSPLSNLIQDISRHGHGMLTRSIPALRLSHIRDGTMKSPLTAIREVAVKTKRPQGKAKRAMVGQLQRLSNLDPNSVGGVYYGISPGTFAKASRPVEKKPSLSDSMAEALDELRTLRQEMETMRKDMQSLKRKMIAEGDFEEEVDPSKMAIARRKRQREYEKISGEIERWAKKILYEEGEEDGWKEVACNKMMVSSLNPSGQTKAYMKWMKDSRGDHADNNDNSEYPCIKVFSTIDAPVEQVCTYLSQEKAVPEYNDIVTKYKDVEEISPQSKICWSQTPQILFLKPRDFITFCHHRWTGDGTQIIVNQATEHPDFPGSKNQASSKDCWGYALRGANFLSRCPDDPEKTRIAMVAHASPGSDIPQWACKTAVNAMAPIEPFKLFHKINENVKRSQPKLQELMSKTEMVSSLPGGRSPRPAGIAQMGYACFWPKGGGLQEGALLDEHDASSSPSTLTPDQQDGIDKPGPENMGEVAESNGEVSESSS